MRTPRALPTIRSTRCLRCFRSINLIVVALFAINIWVRALDDAHPTTTIWLSAIAIGLLVVSGWLGGSWFTNRASASTFRTGPTIRENRTRQAWPAVPATPIDDRRLLHFDLYPLRLFLLRNA
jgi:hypothetical protein